jgi:hypothetical protein
MIMGNSVVFLFFGEFSYPVAIHTPKNQKKKKKEEKEKS